MAAVSAPVRTPLHGAVRSEMRSRSAGAPARMRRVVHHPVRGDAGTGDARSATGDARCAKREHGTDAAAWTDAAG